MYQVYLDKNAKQSFKKLEKSEQRKIVEKLKKLKENPYLGKRLAGNLFGLWKLRIDKHRILYKIEEGKLIIIVLKIGHRKNVY